MESDILVKTIDYIGRAKNAPIHPLSVDNIALKSGKTTALIGANGSGKSTFLNTLAGLRPDFTITVRINSKTYTDSPRLIDINLAMPVNNKTFLQAQK